MERTLLIGQGTEGYASGRLFVARHATDRGEESSKGAEQEKLLFRSAVGKAKAELIVLAAENDIFAAHLEMLEDPMLEEQVGSCIESGLSAKAAVTEAGKAIAEMFSLIDDEYLRARADDVRDICSRITEQLSGKQSLTFEDMPDGCILAADWLLPSETARIDKSRLRGIALEQGSITSHVCIMARGLGIPVIIGIKGLMDSVMQDCEALILAKEGQLVLNPDGSDKAVFSDLITAYEKAMEECRDKANAPAVTKDGKTIPVYANAGSVEDVRQAMELGADGIGLFRTEFLYMHGSQLPDEESQFEAYKEAALACGGKPLTIRTLDIGGDKSLPYLQLPEEENPFLGVRAVRLCLRHRDMFMTQLRAIMRAAVFGNIKVMFPMICNIEELRSCKAMIEEARQQTGAGPVPVGIMVETPASVLMAGELAAECDFMSIGSNDLTQYLMAADRGNQETAYLYDQRSPAVMKAIRMVTEAAGIPVSLCGELASDPDMTARLIEAGLDALSVSVSNIPAIKSRIRES